MVKDSDESVQIWTEGISQISIWNHEKKVLSLSLWLLLALFSLVWRTGIVILFFFQLLSHLNSKYDSLQIIANPYEQRQPSTNLYFSIYAVFTSLSTLSTDIDRCISGQCIDFLMLCYETGKQLPAAVLFVIDVRYSGWLSFFFFLVFVY